MKPNPKLFHFSQHVGAVHLCRALTVVLLFSATLDAYASSLACRDIFQSRGDSIELGPDRGWHLHSTAAARLQTAIAVENRLRRLKGLPEIILSTTPVNYAFPVEISGEPTEFWTSSGFPDEPTMPRFRVSGNLLIRDVNIDIFSLNNVYAFSGPNLEGVTPFAQWKIEHSHGSRLHLFRRLGASELSLWNKAQIKNLGSDWGHVDASGHAQRVVHFSTSAEWTTSAEGEASPLIEIIIDKSEVSKWMSEGKPLWAAALNSDASVSELVFPVELLQRLEKARALHFRLLNSSPANHPK